MRFEIQSCELRLKDLEREFHLEIPRLKIPDASKVAIVGASGCGKSTLLRILALLQPCKAQKLLLSDSDLSINVDVDKLWRSNQSAALRSLRAKHIGYIASESDLYSSLTILENSLLRLKIADINFNSIEEKVETLSKALELPPALLNTKIHKLSRGQKIRGALMQAYIHTPAFVIADEPTSALHPALAERVLKFMLSQLNKNSGLVIATHDVDLVTKLGFKIIHARTTQKGNILKTEFKSF